VGLKRALAFLLVFLGIAVPVAVGLWVRLDDAEVWKKNPSLYYHDGKPLFTSYDAFYFALWTKEYLEGRYEPGGNFTLKFVPDGSQYPDPIPLESWMTAKIVKLTGSSIEEVALWLTPLLAVLVAVPLFLYFYRMGLPLAGFSGALLTVISYAYLIRTSIVRFDTDSLNLFFPFSIALFLYLSLEAKGRFRFLWAAAAGLFSQLYYWWYLHPGLILLFVPFYLLALYLKEGIEKREKLYLLLTFVLLGNPLIFAEGLWNLFNLVVNYLINSFKPQVGGFPNVQKTVVELKHFELYRLSKFAAGSFPLFAVGAAGAVLLFLKEWKRLLPLIPFALIGLLSFVGGNRFIIYLSPFIGLGFGYLLERLISSFGSNSSLKLALPAALLSAAAILASNVASFKFVASPRITPQLAAEFSRLSSLTPDGSWIWTWWDYGTAIIYYSGRATYHDPQTFGSPKTYFVARSFVENSAERAYNSILGVSALGAEGIKELVENGTSVEEVIDQLLSGAYSRPPERPIFWLFSHDQLLKFPAISYIGSWYFGRKEGRFFTFIPKTCFKKGSNYLCGGWIVNPNEGYLLIPLKDKTYKRVDLKRFAFAGRGGTSFKEKFWKGEGRKLTFEVASVGRNVFVGVLLDEEAYRSLFNKMFVLRQYDRRFFTLVRDAFPIEVVYGVKGR